MRRLCLLVTLAAPLAVTSAGCGPSSGAPILDPIDNQTAYVASEFTLELRASDPELDALEFSFSADVDDIGNRAQIRPYGDGSSAVFRWTPIASDVGVHLVDFSVSDGSSSATETVSIEVKSSVGENNTPVFRQPLGTGTTLDLATRDCLELDVVVEDADSSSVELAEEPPGIEGATLETIGPLSATWRWCPTEDQIATQDRWPLVLSADDGENPKASKNFLIVLRKVPKSGCPGEAPAIDHTPEDESTLVGLTVVAQISDAEGVKGAPLFYYSTTPPAEPPDLATMTQLTMLLLDGDENDGIWGADVPNPVVGMAAGASANLYYIIVAQDNDDDEGDCDHLTQAPTDGTFEMTVTNPGGAGGLGLCSRCTADVQCGGAGDNCIRMGASGEAYCGRSCTFDSDCPADYSCSLTSVESVDRARARQCIPDSYACVTVPDPTCDDDMYEENDERTSAAVLIPGSYSLMSCTSGSWSGDDQDWYQISVTVDSQVTVALSGGAEKDLDLALVDGAGSLITRSNAAGSIESITRCLAPGTYFVRVYGWGSASTAYSLTWTRTPMTCAAACVDDSEDTSSAAGDDSTSAARRVDNDLPHSSTGNAICAGDDDWYRIYLWNGDTVHVTLAFTQASPSEDLDIHFYKGTMDLTPCSEADASTCAVENGQGGDSNENFVRTVSQSSYYYVVVRGWADAENTYDICIGLDSSECPPLP